MVLLSMPLSSRDAVTVLSLDQYPPLMSLLSRRTHKDMALRVVQAVLAQVCRLWGHGPHHALLLLSANAQGQQPVFA